MNRSIALLVFVGMSLSSGCAVTAQGQGSPERTSKSAQSLTLQQCADQRDACMANDPLLGWLLCPAQYDQCAASASNGLPAQINSAISDAAACASANRSCLAHARSRMEIGGCGTTYAECVASVVQDHLPSVVSGTVSCVDNAVSCINNSEQVSDLTTCANDLESCAVTQAQKVLPEDVGARLGQVASCQTTLNSCITAATTPADVTACSQSDASCIANGLGVTLPDVTVSGVVKCAQTAADCTIDATTADAVRACASNLTSCVAEATGGATPPPLTCAEKWTACLVQNPLNFVMCDNQLRSCQ